MTSKLPSPEPQDGPGDEFPGQPGVRTTLLPLDGETGAEGQDGGDAK